MVCAYLYAYLHTFTYVCIKYLWKDKLETANFVSRKRVEWLGDRKAKCYESKMTVAVVSLNYSCDRKKID